jgi:uncharacterized protein (TIGR00725 family)
MADERPYIAVVGPSEASVDERELGEQLGGELARAGSVILTGGLGGVMAAACRGAARDGGMTVGILPGVDRRAANPDVQLAIATGLGELRNGLLVRACDALIAVGGGYGTLSEIALALRAGVPVTGLGSWTIEGVESVATPAEAVRRALARVADRAG